LKAHVSRHLQQLALFAIPRANYSAVDKELDENKLSQDSARASRSRTDQDTAHRDSDSSVEFSENQARDTGGIGKEGLSEELGEQLEIPFSGEIAWDLVTDKFSKARDGQSELAPITVMENSFQVLVTQFQQMLSVKRMNALTAMSSTPRVRSQSLCVTGYN
jgi:hypothetical protein